MTERSRPSEVLVDVEGRTLALKNLDKVIYPRTGTTKGEVLNYYARIAPVMLPHLADRAVTRIRWPHGVEDLSFFEKNAPAGTPSWVRTVEVPTSAEKSVIFPICGDLSTLTWLANLAALELHVHQWRVGRTGRPRPSDRIVVDLDPGEPAGLQECSQVALLVRDLLAEHDLVARPVLSGSKGLHLYADLPGGMPAEEASALARGIATRLQAQEKALVTATMAKSARRGKVFLDWSQNAASKTTVAPYSLRATPWPQVAAPVSWAEVEAGAIEPDGLEQMRFTEVLSRVAEHGDLFVQGRP